MQDAGLLVVNSPVHQFTSSPVYRNKSSTHSFNP
jgi:hypothetical protein